MRTLTAIVITAILISASLTTLPIALGEPTVGVKKGDWMEYSVNVACGAPPPKLDLNSFRMEILDVHGAAFEGNFSSRFNNGTVVSAVWQFNLTEGNVGGWTIIPANLA